MISAIMCIGFYVFYIAEATFIRNHVSTGADCSMFFMLPFVTGLFFTLFMNEEKIRKIVVFTENSV